MDVGDVLLTGTPAGVTQVRAGDRIRADLRIADGTVAAELAVRVEQDGE